MFRPPLTVLTGNNVVSSRREESGLIERIINPFSECDRISFGRRARILCFSLMLCLESFAGSVPGISLKYVSGPISDAWRGLSRGRRLFRLVLKGCCRDRVHP